MNIDERIKQFTFLMQKILHDVNRSSSREQYIERVSRLLLTVLDVDRLELRVREVDWFHWGRAERRGGRVWFRSSHVPYPLAFPAKRLPIDDNDSAWERLCRAVFVDERDFAPGHFTAAGGFFSNNLTATVLSPLWPGGAVKAPDEAEYRSAAIIPLHIEQRRLGLMCVASRQADFFTANLVHGYESLAGVVAAALSHQRAMFALQLRVKELSCLNEIAQAISRPDVDPDETLGEIARMIGPAFRYPEIASCRIETEDRVYLSSRFREGDQRLSVPIVVRGRPQGRLEVNYAEPRPALDIGPFLQEEEQLLRTVASQIALLLVEKRIKTRIVTMAQQFSAPLNRILGFSELMLREEDVPERLRSDLEKVQRFSMEAREIVRKISSTGDEPPAGDEERE